MWTEVPFIQEVSGVYTSPFLDTDELKMAVRGPEKFPPGTFEKRNPGFSTEQSCRHSKSTRPAIKSQLKIPGEDLNTASKD